MTAATQFITKTYRQHYRKDNKIATAFYDSADPYDDFVSELARKFTNSPDEARAAVLEMQADIQRCAEKGVGIEPNEDGMIARVAWRRLLKFLQ
ncbi:MAG: hypothetical protein ABIV48_13865 [Pyrinomonadaceae bacterium]